MKNIAFVIWMLFCPFLDKLGDYLLFLRGIKPHEFTVEGLWIQFVFYIIIAVLLYEKRE